MREMRTTRVGTRSPTAPYCRFPMAAVSLAVAYNALQVVADMAATVAEIARVLEHGGTLCACIAHPVTDLGRFDDGRGRERAFTLRDGYFDNVRVDDTVESNGLTMTFRGWTYSLEDYSVALEDAGLRVEAIREPRPAGSPSRYERWRARAAVHVHPCGEAVSCVDTRSACRTTSPM